jgi:F-type H+-transporting ATPase subunit delta
LIPRAFGKNGRAPELFVSHFGTLGVLRGRKRCVSRTLKPRGLATGPDRVFYPESLAIVIAEDPSLAGVAGRYASALFELARDGNQIDAVASELDRFAALISESPDLQRLVRSPVFSAQQQLQALTAVLERAGIGGLAANFLKLVAANRRLFAVDDMIKKFKLLLARYRREVSAEVILAEELQEKHLSALNEALQAVTGQTVKLKVTIDNSIIGGLVVKLGSRMLDASVKSKLNSLRQAMKEVG